jgi:hypothetical protein
MTKVFALKNDDQYPVRFLHIRSRPNDGMSAKRDSNNRVDTSYGGFTVAYNPLLMIRKDGSVGVFVELGVAKCSGHDRYVKKIGREKSTQFLNNPADGCLTDGTRSNGYVSLYLGEGDVGDFIEDTIPLVLLNTGELYINERLFNLRNVVAARLGFAGY